MTRKRKVLAAALSLALLALLAVGAAVLVLRSSWFYGKVRAVIVSTLADATGGRVSVGALQFDWRRMRADVTSLEIAGKEPAGKPPLFRAGSVAVALKIVSLLKRDVDIQSLEIRDPRIYLIVYPDGSTNIPEPKVKRAPSQTMETILKLAVGRFQVENGLFEIESRSKVPFDLRGTDLNAALRFEPAGPRYRGEISAKELAFEGAGYHGVFSLTAAAAFEKDRIALTFARLATGNSAIQLSGVLENLAAPRALVHFDSRVTAADASRILNEKLLERGEVELAGTAQWSGGSEYSLAGRLHAYDLDYRGAYVQLRGFRADGAISAEPAGIGLRAVRLSGTADRLSVAGRVGAISIRGGDLAVDGIALAVLGGTFSGNARIRELQRFSLTGEIAGIEARRAVALYSPQALPWNSRVAGTVRAEGLLQRKYELRASADLDLEPAADSAPVRGHISAAYDTRTGTLDLGRSHVALPSSRAEFSGVLGHQMLVHLETRDFDDLLPVLGSGAAALPVKVENGSAVFDGAVTGALDDPKVTGHLTAASLVYSGEKIDSLAADVAASRQNVALRNATASRGSLRAQFEGAVELHDWKAEDSSLIAGSGSVRNASLADVLAAARQQLPLSGTLTGDAQVNGTVGNPIVKADFTAARGTFHDEPFDRIAAHLEWSGRTLTASGGQIAAGPKQITFGGAYDHAPGSLASGRLRFRVASNSMPLEAVEAIHRDRPDVQGAVQATANGVVDLAPAQGGELGIRVSELHADVTAQGLRAAGQALGDAHLTANTEGQALRAHLDSSFAGSAIKGDGEWRLEGDYPGSGNIVFPKIDLAQARAWLSPDVSGYADRLRASADGQIHFEGPALRPDEIKAQLRIANFEVGTVPAGSSVPAIALRNSGPIVASIARSAITVDSMRLVGRNSDLAVTGKINLARNAPDLRVNGRVDLAIVHEFNPDFRTSGNITADATVRGTLASPAVSGRTEFRDVSFSVADLPNGLSNANGVITFTGSRATIQSLSAETGGGKVQLSGFAGYEGGQTIFRIHARVSEVRVRYPEGVSTVADATLNLTGSLERSMLAGTVTIRRTGFNPQTDFSSLIAQSAQPVQTPSARAGFLGGLGFDIQVNTAPDLEFQSSLAQDLQMEANLRLRGTFSNPAVLGRVNLTQGQIVFFGTKYDISQGSISFFNPIRIEPVFDIALETKARGIDITLAITGPLNKLNLTPRSDPPLQFSEIVALLATGRTPTNDPTLLAQQASGPQSWQQMGASALLGQAIASPVAGRLQRFFGVSKLRIDPSFPGVEYTPQARLTLEQQVTPDITFTYITYVTTSNPQVVRVEWAFSRRWSAVALREENGVFGIDFLYKKRF